MFFLFAAVEAAEIQVVTDMPVMVEVDGRVITARGGERGSLATNLAGGAHKVQVFDASDRLLAAATVDVRVDEQLRLELRRGALSELGRGPLPNAAPPAPPAIPGTFQLTGLDPTNVAVWVDGQPVAWSQGSFVARNITPGNHDVRVARGAETLSSGPMKFYPELVRRCAPDGRALECVFVERVEAIAPAPPPPPAPPAGPIAVNERDFAAIVAGVKGQTFSSDQLGVLKGASRDRWFTIEQVGTILDLFTHSSDKVEAARLLAPRVVDPQNAWKLDAKLTFSSDKEAVRALFGR